MAHSLALDGGRRRRYFTVGLLATFLTSLHGCECDCPNPDGDALGMATLPLTIEPVPDGVGCAVVIVAGDGPQLHRVNVTPGRASTLDLGNLFAAQTVVSVEAVQGPCDARPPSTTVVAVGGPVVITLAPGTNPPVTLALQPEAGGATLFDPMAGRTCQAPATACDRNDQCCSLFCYTGTMDMPLPGRCTASEPPPTTAQLERSLRPLANSDGHGSLPEFDGDAFFVTFPGPRLAPGELVNLNTVRRQFIDPVAEAIGFTDLGRLENPRSFKTLAGGDYGQLLEARCAGAGQDNGPAKDVCDLLADPAAKATPAGDELVARLGMPLPSLVDEVNRPLQYWFFKQLQRGVVLEHKGAMAVQPGDTRGVTAVFGALVQQKRVVNTVARNGRASSVLARQTLSLLEGLVATSDSKDRREATLVLLPYGTVLREPAVTGLRFAWRMSVVGQLAGTADANHRAYTIWIDAQNGDLLKYSTDSVSDRVGAPATALYADADGSEDGPDAGAVDASAVDATPVADASVDRVTRTNSYHNMWCRDPEANATCSAPANLVDGGYPLHNETFELVQGASGAVPASTPALASATPTMTDECASPGTSNSPTFRQANLFFQLERARALAEHSGRLGAFTPRIRVHLDTAENDNVAVFDPPSIKFRGVPRDCLTATPSQVVAGDVDGTIVAHEFAHLVTLKLQAEVKCAEENCPKTNPYHREAFHDFADGYAALMTGTPCIGGWSYRNRKTANSDPQKARHLACGEANEGSDLPRLLFAEDEARRHVFRSPDFQTARDTAAATTPPGVAMDRFPVHRKASPGPYGDGQIVGAALWHAWEGLQSQAGEASSMFMFGRLNEAIFSTGFSPTVCPEKATRCDSNIYRAGRELLFHLARVWISSGAPHSVNKLLSGFARAGIFLAPRNCLDVEPMGSSTTVPHFCPTGTSRADAIVDIDDGEGTDDKFRLGVWNQDDDTIELPLPSATSQQPDPRPFFRIWTGPNVQFDSTGLATEMMTPDCNDMYRLEVRYRESGQAWPTDWTRLVVDGSVTNCYATHRFTPPNPSVAAATVEGQYRVKTWRSMEGEAGPSNRSSVKPGNDMWPSGIEGIAPALFFVKNRRPPP